MKRFYLPTVLVCLFAALATACKKDNTDNDEPKPPVVTPQLTVEVDSVFFQSAAAENRIVPVTASDNSWMASCQADWCKVNTAKNDLGEKELRIGVTENQSLEARECTVTLTLDQLSASLVVRQLGVNSDEAREIITEQDSYTAGHPEAVIQIPVVADGTFTASSSQSWAVCGALTQSEDGKTLVNISVAQNTSPSERSAEITLSSRWTSKTLTLTQEGYIPLYVPVTEFKTGFGAGTVEIAVVSEEEYTVTVQEGKNWLSVIEEESTPELVKIAIAENTYPIEREATVTLSALGQHTTVTITQVAFKEFGSLTDDNLAPDISIPVISADASSTTDVRPLDNLYDGSDKTVWASDVNTNADFVDINLYFDNKSGNQIDYMLIYHTNRLSWGQFGLTEIYATGSDGNETLIAKKDCGQLNSGFTRFDFSPALENTASIRIRVLSSTKSSASVTCVQASAAEVSFFKKNPDVFDPLNIFTDQSCTKLKDGVTLDDIDGIDNDFYKSIAEQIYMGVYNQFRICEAKPYPHPDRDADIHLTKPMGTLIDNVTGMYIPQTGQEHIILVGDTYDQRIVLRVVDWPTDGGAASRANNESDYVLSPGRNKIKFNHKGMLYVLYHTDDYASLKPVNINFPTASVNGYFDITKHSLDDFLDIFEQATTSQQRNFDMVTEHCLLCFPKEAYRSATLLNNPRKNVDRVKDMLTIFDTVFVLEEELQGLLKYQKLGLQREWRNKGPFYGDYGGGYGYSGWYVTGYGIGSMALDLLNPTTMWNKTAASYNNGIVGAVWGLAHELGHSTQTAAFEWRGLSEVTNNLNCAMVQYKFFGEGNTTMRFNDHFNRGMRDIVTRIVTERDGSTRRMTHCESVNTPSAGNVDGGVDPTTQLEPFWQLYLYYHLVMGNEDFYPDFYEICRQYENYERTDAKNQRCMLDYIKHVSDAAQEDLSDFCDAWGLPGINNRMKVNHYGQNFVTTTQAELDEMYAYCKKYPKPKLNPLYINDLNVDMYRNPQPVVAGTHTYTANGRYTMSGWSGVVAWELVDPETNATICIHTNEATFTYSHYPTIYMNNASGTDYVYSNSNNTNRALQKVTAVYYPDALVYGVAADGTKVASLSNPK